MQLNQQSQFLINKQATTAQTEISSIGHDVNTGGFSDPAPAGSGLTVIPFSSPRPRFKLVSGESSNLQFRMRYPSDGDDGEFSDELDVDLKPRKSDTGKVEYPVIEIEVFYK
jgi:hypothetical protein